MYGEYSSQPNPEAQSSDDALRLHIHRLAQRFEHFSGSRDAADLLVALAALGAQKDRLKPVDAVDAIVAIFDTQQQQAAYIAELEQALIERDEAASAVRIIEVDTTSIPAPEPAAHTEELRPVSEVISQYPDKVAIVGVEFLSQIAASLRVTLETIVVDDPEIRQIKAALMVLGKLEVYLNS